MPPIKTSFDKSLVRAVAQIFVALTQVSKDKRVEVLLAQFKSLLQAREHPTFTLDPLVEDKPHYAPGCGRVGFSYRALHRRSLSNRAIYRFSHELWHLFQDVFIIRYIRYRNPELPLSRIQALYERVTDCWEVPQLVKTALQFPLPTFEEPDERRARQLISSVRRRTGVGKKLRLVYDVLDSINVLEIPNRTAPVITKYIKRLVAQLVAANDLLFARAEKPDDLAQLLDSFRTGSQSIEQNARETLPVHFDLIRALALSQDRKLHPTQWYERDARQFAHAVLREYKKLLRA